MARAAKSNYTIYSSLNTDGIRKGVAQAGGDIRNFSGTAAGNVSKLNVAILAAGAAFIKMGSDAVSAFKDVEAAVLNIQYAFEDMNAAGRAAVIEVSRDIARGAGVSLRTATEIQSSFVSGGFSAERAAKVARPVADFVDAIGKEGGAYSDALISANLTTGRDVLELQDIIAAVAPRVRGGIGRGGTELLAQSFGTLTSQAKALDLKEEDVAALIAQGSFMGRRATTGINHVRAILEEAMDKDSPFAKTHQHLSLIHI